MQKIISPSQLTRPQVLRALAIAAKLTDVQIKDRTGYAASRTYALVYKKRTYSAKGIVALAFKRATGSLPSESFSGGMGSGCAGRILTDLGFEVTGA